MRVVVTGAAGLTGSELVERLIARQHEVHAIVRRASSVPGAASIAVGDCADAAILGPLLRDADVLVHGAGVREGPRIAAVPGVSGVRSIVIVSSAGVYSRHRASAAAYRAGESALSGVPRSSLIVRPTMIYGTERDKNIHHVIAMAARTGVLPLFGRGETLIQPIHFTDLAAALVVLVETMATGIVDAGGGTALSVRDLLREVFAALGQRPRLIPLPFVPSVAVARFVDRLRGGRLSERLERLTEDRSVDNTRLLALTGIQPRSFSQGVRDEVRHLREIGWLR